MGPLQIKIAFLNAIGDWLEGSGWLAIFERARMTTDRCIDSFISGSKIKRSRNAYQVSLAALIKLARLAFEAQKEYLNCGDWTRHHCSESATVSYWLTVIDLEVLFFMFIRSLREEKNIVPWMFCLVHIHYARRLPVFLVDFRKMSNESNHVLEQFNKGYFTVSKTDRHFSNMGVDQAHEPNNKVV